MAKLAPTSDDWSGLVKLSWTLDDLRMSLRDLENQYEKRRRAIMAKLVAGATIENGGRVSWEY